MTKVATAWKPRSGYGSVESVASKNITREGGGTLLLESGGALLTETSDVDPKNATVWDLADTKNATIWNNRSGYGSVESIEDTTRTTESGDVRITEQGDTRILEPSDFDPKPQTVWS